jgi:ABC-type branched-subunit amino acid transport system ATPase component
MSILVIQNLSKSFDGLVVLDNLTISLEKGSINALIGPNGAGKTSLFNIINGFWKPEKGEIFFKDVKINNLAPNEIAKMGISRTFQKIRLFPQLTVLENMLLATKYQKGEGLFAALFEKKMILDEEKENIKRSLEYLEYVGLLEKKDALSENLSYGQRKLLELSRALVFDAELILLDEPTSGVFPETKDKIIKIIKKLNDDGKTIFFIEHDMDLVMQLAERIIVLSNGKMIADGSPEKIIHNDHVKEAYLGKRKSIA